MLKDFRQAARRQLANCGRGPISSLCFRGFRRPRNEAGGVSVHMLVSSRTWHAGLLAAAAFEHHTNHRWRFFIHEDGTVGPEARGCIENLLPDATFVSRGEADARAGSVLRDFPLCLSQRSKHNLFLKFSDFAAFAPEKRFIVLDSDVIFFRRPAKILEWLGSGSMDAFYNEDTKEKYCIPRDRIADALGIDLWPRFNSGLLLLPRAAIDFSLAERLLAAFESTAHHPQFFEQTLYALMASAWGRGGPLPAEYEISWGYLKKRGAVCRHYVGEFKHDLLYIEGAPLFLASVLVSKK